MREFDFNLLENLDFLLFLRVFVELFSLLLFRIFVFGFEVLIQLVYIS